MTATPTMPADPTPAWAVEMLGIDKRFGPVHANRSVDFRAAAGSIHGLVGENGAGKSTLMSILYGFYEADAGEIRVDGRPVRLRGSDDAIRAGIGMVHQHFMLVETFTVLENLLLGLSAGVLLGPAKAQLRAKVEEIERSFGLDVPLDFVVGDLPVGLQQRVEILKALVRGARVLILDEPTAVLAPQETALLFRILERLRDEGRTILLITHKLKEVKAVTDRVTVMRQGAIVAEFATATTDIQTIANAMVGRRATLSLDKPPIAAGPPLLEVAGLTVRDGRGVTRVKQVDITVRAGEIVGIAGVAGNGQSELLECLAGMLPAAGGTIRVKGAAIGPGWSPAQARRSGVAHVPEDRLRLGVVKPWPARDNAVLGHQADPDLAKGSRLSWAAIGRRTASLMDRFDVRPRAPRLRLALFSGGNQQKLVMGREIARDPDILLVGQPTRGVDIGAIAALHGHLLDLRARGKAILLVSAELDELLALSDRLLVMCDGRMTGELDPATAEEGTIGRLMAGLAADPTAAGEQAA